MTSSEGGCVVAASREAKKLGIKIGDPVFRHRSLFEMHGVHQAAANFSLYSDMSARVFSTLNSLGVPFAVYSIDEAFVELTETQLNTLPQMIKDKIYRWTGIPVSIGVASTLTLAKVAAQKAKLSGKGLWILKEEDVSVSLAALPVEEIWGIGHRLAALLHKNRIVFAGEFRDLPDTWLKKKMSVVGWQTALELRGVPCFDIHHTLPQRQSVTYSRSFATPLHDFEEVAMKLSYYVERAAEKIRQEKLAATSLEVVLMTSRFGQEEYYATRSLQSLPAPSSYTPDLIHAAKEGLRSIFLEGLAYKKTGITLLGLIQAPLWQVDLFEEKEETEKKKRIMEAVDRMNRKKKHAVSWGSSGIKPDREKVPAASLRYTTSWEELLTAH